MAYRSLTFDTEVGKPTNGNPPGVSYVSGSAHYINNVYVKKELDSPLKVDMTLGSLKTDVFGDSLVFALLADKPMTFGDPSSGTDISSWKSWYRPANSVTGTGTTKPSYLINGTGQAARPTMLFDEGEIVTLPSAYFHFGATEPFTIFVALEAVTKNSAREAYLFGGTNPSRTELVSIWGIDNNKCAVIDAGNNEELWSGSLMHGDSIRMLSRTSNGKLWDYQDGIEVLEDSTTFTDAFNFNFINKGNTSDGDQGSGTFEINEILIYDEDASTMGTTKRQEIEGYLAHKWETNSALRNANGSTGHPYVTTDPRDAEDWKFSSPATTSKHAYDESSPPAFNNISSATFDVVALGSGTGGVSVSANQLVKFAVVDMEKPGKVYIKVDYTVA